MTASILFAEVVSATLNADANAAELAKQGYWGMMIAILGFLAFALVLITLFMRGQQTAIHTLFAKAIDANAKLSEAIDALGDETRESNLKLQQYLDRNLDKVASAIRDIGARVDDHSERITQLENQHQRGPNS